MKRHRLKGKKERLFVALVVILGMGFLWWRAYSGRSPDADGNRMIAYTILGMICGTLCAAWREIRTAEKLFQLLERLAQFLPEKMRLDVFEPAYQDEKGNYLVRRAQYGRLKRFPLGLLFVTCVLILAFQSFWTACVENIKKKVGAVFLEFLK